jgi:hypothetical protein
MAPSRLAVACALVSRAMGGRDPAALAPVAAEVPARALGEAASLAPGELDGLAAGLLAPARVEHLHPSWLGSALARLAPAERTSIVRLMPPAMARYAALALEREGCAPERPGAARAPAGETIETRAALLAPPQGTDPAGAGDDPLARISGERARRAVDEVYGLWPERARRIECSARAGKALVALAACLAARPDEASGLAARLVDETGRALLAAHAGWTIALDADEAERLASRHESQGG